LTLEQKKGSVSEFNFIKGVIVAVCCGVLSAAMAVGLDTGKSIAAAADHHLKTAGRLEIWQGLPELIIILLGGFVTNFVWCIFLNLKNRSGHQYVAFNARRVTEISATLAVSTYDLDPIPPSHTATPADSQPVPLFTNYIFAALAGLTWYFQFFFYTMGSTEMGEKYGFSSWTLHMASIIIFSTLWGIYFKEWKGTSKRTHRLIAAGLAVLVLSTMVIGLGSYLKQPADIKIVAKQ
jgi:L-rhamnose-H+ transport protein